MGTNERVYGRPVALPEPERREFTASVESIERRLDAAVERLLSDIDSEAIQEEVYTVAFAASEALPKRVRRPAPLLGYLVEQVTLAYDPDGEHTDALLEFTVAVHEYYDIFDDLVDGDVADAWETEVTIAQQFLLPLIVRRLQQFGQRATDYWSDHAIRKLSSEYLELSREPSIEAYLDIVAVQAELFGFLTGTAAIVAGADDEEIDRAAAVGRTFYEFEQLLLDREQARDDDNPWNAWVLADEETVLSQLRQLRSESADLVEQFPSAQATAIRGLFAVDFDTWLAEEPPRK
jgi:hypothetical protein